MASSKLCGVRHEPAMWSHLESAERVHRPRHILLRDQVQAAPARLQHQQPALPRTDAQQSQHQHSLLGMLVSWWGPGFGRTRPVPRQSTTEVLQLLSACTAAGSRGCTRYTPSTRQSLLGQGRLQRTRPGSSSSGFR